MKLIMPMAGEGSRFSEQGYSTIKPLIEVNGLPMFVFAERCIGIDFDEHVFIIREEHSTEFSLDDIIKQYYPKAHIVKVNGVTEGAACTLMLAREHFEDGSDLFVSNCDQYIKWDSQKAVELMNQDDVDGLIAVFKDPARDKKWSFAKVDDHDNVQEVAEKNPISEWATAGYYYWKNGKQFIKSVENMMAANDRVNNEFYTCPVYNYTIKLEDSHNIKIFEVDKMMGTGTPADLVLFNNTKRFYNYFR
jgi:dTDP-glucose pyrophosphorylase